MFAFTCIGGLVNVLLLLSVQTLPVCTGNVNLDSLLAPRVTDFKLSLHRHLEGSRIRSKRNIQNPLISEDYQMRVGSSDEVDLEYLSQYTLTFWIPVKNNYQNQVLIGTQDGYLLLFELTDTDDKIGRMIANSTQGEIATKAMAFTHLDDQWFAVLHSSGASSWIRVYKRLGRGLEMRQVINLEGDADFDMVTVKNVHYLAVVTFTTTPAQPGFSLYQWTKTQLDEIAVRQVHGARSVACWVLDGTIYFAVAQEFNEHGNYAVGSPIFMFNSKEESDLVFRQMLSTYGPTKVLHFSIGGSNYVVFIGMREAAIYWWANDQFLLFQTINGTAYASDVATLVLESGEVVIVIALREEALFLTLDDSGQYVVPYSLKFTGLDLVSLQFMYSGEAFYFLPLFATYRPHRFSKLTLRPYYMPSGSSLDTLRQCVKDVFEILDERQVELSNTQLEISRVWLKDKNQTITTDVIIKGETSSIQMTIITEVLVLIDEKLPPESSLSQVENDISLMMSLIDDVNQNIGQSVLKSIRQDIAGFKSFYSALSIPSLNMESTTTDIKVNGIFVSRVNQFALRKHGSQTLDYLFNIASAYAEWVTSNTLNSVDINDFLLLKGEQTVTGYLTFNNLFSEDLLVNSINTLSTDDFVTVDAHQDIKDLKVLSSIRASKIKVQGELNREDLDAFYWKIVTKAGDDTLNGKSIMRSTVVIEGNLISGFINGVVDIDSLETNTVTVSTEQTLKGPFTFMAPVSILQDLTVGTVNSIYLNSLVTLHTKQTINSNIWFNSMDLERDLTVNSVNGYKLRDTVLLHTAEPQFVAGFVTFTGPVGVDNIVMSDFVTLDDVDPSLLAQDIVRHEEGIVTLNSTEFDNVVVTEHLTAMGGVNGYFVSDLLGLVWLKSAPQEMEVPVHVVKMSTENIMEVNEVNKIHLDTDVVHTYGDEPIVSPKIFHEQTVVKTSFNIDGGTMINGFDFTNVQKELENLANEGSIKGNKDINKLEIIGNIDASVLNEVHLTDFMHPNAQQDVTGQVEFPSDLTLIPENLKVRDISFHTFNGKDLRSYFTNPVLKSNFEGVSNKGFSNIIAQNFIMDHESLLNGFQFDDMARRIVMLNTSQDISSAKNFWDAVYILQPSVALKLNGLDLSNILKDVVFTDQEGVIPSKKTLKGTVQGGDFLADFINGVDVSVLSENAFLKSKSNVVVPLTTFTSGLKVGNLIVSSHLNELSFEDLIILTEDEHVDFLYLPNTRVANLWITGLLDDCDLTEIERKSLITSTLSQRIPQDVKIESIHVIGNLYIQSPVNDIPMQNINGNVITVDGDQVITSSITLGPNWRSNNITIGDKLNERNLPFLMNDAVRHSVLKDINGLKIFYDVKTNALKAGNLNADTLDGVNVDELYNKAVLKNTEQTIAGENVFSSLKADVVTVTGFLNGLRFPQDVVLTATTEHISSTTTFMSDLVLASNIIIEGNINYVALSNFVQNRVTLTGDESIPSSLSFNKDVNIKDTSIDGTVNDIVLEMITRRIYSTPVEGEKTFTNLLHISNSMSSYSINGYDLELLNRSILRKDEDGYIKPEQDFFNLKAKNLRVQSVNTISLPELPIEFYSRGDSFNTTRDAHDSSSSSLVRKISNQLQMFENQVTQFGYFALIQEINLGPTSKILYGYREKSSYGGYSHSLVAWTSRRQCSHMELCCDQELSQWLRVERNGKLVPEHSPSQGRFYPLNDPTPTMVDSNFVVWTNWTKSQPKWCDKIPGSMFLASYSHSGFFEGVLSISNAPLLSDIKTFKEGHLYAVAGFHYDRTEDYYTSSIVYKFHEMMGAWKEHQILPSYGALSLDVAYVTNYGIRELLLAIGTGTATHSSVFKWIEEDHKFGLLQHIPSKYVTSTLWVKEGFNQLLVLANVEKWPRRGENCIDLVSGGEINVYSYEERLTWIQSIPLQGVVSMLTFSLKGDTFLVAASGQLQTIYVYEWKGYAGFSLVQSMFVGEVRHLSYYILENDFYLTVAIESGPSKVMKIVVQGNNFQAITYKDDPVYPDQQDEAMHDVKPGC